MTQTQIEPGWMENNPKASLWARFLCAIFDCRCHSKLLKCAGLVKWTCRRCGRWYTTWYGF